MSAENGIKNFEQHDILSEIEQEYNKCLTPESIGDIKIPSLKYAFYNLDLKITFLKKIKIIQTNIEKVQKSLSNKNNVDKIKETEQLNNIKAKLFSFEKETIEKYELNKNYLVNLAKRADKLKNPVADRVYINASEDIIQSVIKYYINCEKYFILFNDIINNLIKKFHI
jgi:hypothetical protein